MTNPTPEEDAERIVQTVLDAVHHGSKRAAEMHNCSEMTISRYRTQVRTNPELAMRYAALFIQHNRDALARQRDRKEQVLNSLVDSVIKKEDTKHIDVATRAYRAIADAFLAESIALGLNSDEPVTLQENEAGMKKKNGRRNHQSSENSGTGSSVREVGSGNATITIPGSKSTQ